MANCKDAVERLYEYIDRELTDDELAVVRRHLDHCPPCLDLFVFEENVLTFIGDRCRQTTAPPTLHEKVRKLCQHD